MEILILEWECALLGQYATALGWIFIALGWIKISAVTDYKWMEGW